MQLDGSDAMNPDPDYSAAYCILETDQAGLTGHGLTFTIGRGNDICCAAIAALAPLVEGLDLDWIAEDGARFWRHVRSEEGRAGKACVRTCRSGAATYH